MRLLGSSSSDVPDALHGCVKLGCSDSQANAALMAAAGSLQRTCVSVLIASCGQLSPADIEETGAARTLSVVARECMHAALEPIDPTVGEQSDIGSSMSSLYTLRSTLSDVAMQLKPFDGASLAARTAVSPS